MKKYLTMDYNHKTEVGDKTEKITSLFLDPDRELLEFLGYLRNYEGFRSVVPNKTLVKKFKKFRNK